MTFSSWHLIATIITFFTAITTPRLRIAAAWYLAILIIGYLLFNDQKLTVDCFMYYAILELVIVLAMRSVRHSAAAYVGGLSCLAVIVHKLAAFGYLNGIHILYRDTYWFIMPIIESAQVLAIFCYSDPIFNRLCKLLSRTRDILWLAKLMPMQR